MASPGKGTTSMTSPKTPGSGSKRKVSPTVGTASAWRPRVSCDDPADLSPDMSRLWVIDKPNIPCPPKGWERLLTLRGEGACRFADVYYISPCGKRLRSMVEVERFLEENTRYGATISDFNFQIPRPLHDSKRSASEAQIQVMASATAMALISVPFMQQNYGGFASTKVDSAHISTAFVNRLRSKVYTYSSLKLNSNGLVGFVARKPQFESRLALAVVPPQFELADSKPIGLNGRKYLNQMSKCKGANKTLIKAVVSGQALSLFL
ncbi:hypothetical protein KI387_030879 [Taxus chinensis]|uniref:MBD domain-containing protein n=1 Tax=Taxus chinensis TaxID=29808 RepID=A0AA38CK86_TAXCH|nr:hypothetical protein KI387_030879 [Taxus chinensis]